MVTFDEFLIQYSDIVKETFEGLDLTDTARKAIVTIMKQYLGNRRFDPLDLVNLFQTVCYSAVHKGQLSRSIVEAKVSREMDNYLSDDSLNPDYTDDSFYEKGNKGL